MFEFFEFAFIKGKREKENDTWRIWTFAPKGNGLVIRRINHSAKVSAVLLNQAPPFVY